VSCCAPVIEAGGLPARQVHGFHIPGFETRLLQQLGNRTVEIATATQFIPEGVHAVLPALDALVRSQAMFTENQLAAGFQNTPDFIQGGVDFVDCGLQLEIWSKICTKTSDD